MRYCKEETAIVMVTAWGEWTLTTYSLCSWAEAWVAEEAKVVGAEAVQVPVVCQEDSTWVNKAPAKASPSNSDELFCISLLPHSLFTNIAKYTKNMVNRRINWFMNILNQQIYLSKKL